MKLVAAPPRCVLFAFDIEISVSLNEITFTTRCILPIKRDIQNGGFRPASREVQL
jgi:hypothetical protein